MPVPLSRIVLRQNGHTSTLIGIAHVGPPAMYQKVQNWIDEANGRGEQIFYEGISLSPDRQPADPNVLGIMLKIGCALKMAEKKPPKKEYYIREHDTIRLPKKAVCADMHAAQLAEYFLTTYRGFDDITVEQLRDYATSNGPELDSYVAAILDYGFVGERNKHAVNIIKAHCGSSLTVYGQAHILGMAMVMMLYGWQREHHESYFTLE